MGKLYQQSQQYLSYTESDGIVIEIGSDRWEGSTIWLADLAAKSNLSFYSVDFDESASKRLVHPNVIWQVMEGVQWCKQVLPSLNRKVSLLYLDNFDYEWDINEINDNITTQKKSYLSRNIVMNNQNCQVVHLKQMMALLPYTVKGTVAIFDDTYTHNDCWIGKCGAVVIYLLSLGWNIRLSGDHGVIMVRDS
jgi:hypothetical protein